MYPVDVTGSGGVTGERWATVTVDGTNLLVRAEVGIPQVIRFDEGLYLWLFDVDYGNPYCFQWSFSTGNTEGVVLTEVSRTSSSVLTQTSNLQDIEVCGIDVRGKLCTDDASGSGVSGSGTPGADWWCVQVSNCTDGACVDCSPEGIDCVEGYFGAVGDQRCLNLGGGEWRQEVALRGPYASASACIAACGGVDVTCCPGSPIPTSLCALFTNFDGMECVDGYGIDLVYVGEVTSDNPNVISPVKMWEGTDDLGICGQNVTLRVYCAQSNSILVCPDADYHWWADVIWNDGCTNNQLGVANDCGDPDMLLSCDPFHLRWSVPANGTVNPGDCGGTGTLGNNFYVDVIPGPCPGSSPHPSVTANSGNVCQDAAGMTINGANFSTTAADNVLTFNLGAIGHVTASTATSLTVVFDTLPTSLGSLTVVVTSSNGSSGSPVAVGTVIDCGSSGISYSPLGTTSDTGTSATMSITVATGALLVVSVGSVGGIDFPSVTFDGDAVDLCASQASATGNALVYKRSVPAGKTGNLVVSGANAGLIVLAAEVVGLASNLLDQTGSATGGSSTASVTASGSTTVNDEYVHAAFFQAAPIGAWAFNAPFTAGQSDGVVVTLAQYTLRDGYRMLTSMSTPTATISDTGMADGAQVMATFS